MRMKNQSCIVTVAGSRTGQAGALGAARAGAGVATVDRCDASFSTGAALPVDGAASA